MTPGSCEFTGDLVRSVMDGHAAHALDQSSHGPPAVEYGCSGPCVCPCHGTTSFVAHQASTEVDAAKGSLVLESWFVADLAAEGIVTGIFRPPTA